MLVRPRELSNLCAIFPSVGSRSIGVEDLRRLASYSRLIDSMANADDIIAAAVHAGLLSIAGGDYCQTPLGKQLGGHQRSPDCIMTESAREFFIKNVLFNPGCGEWFIGKFLRKFRVDGVIGRFVYDRGSEESARDTKWLMILSDLRFIEVNEQQAVSIPAYHGVINRCLAAARNSEAERNADADKENNEVGALAERLALAHERSRLVDNGLPDLAALVQHISKVDWSAGYDILSFGGTTQDPSSSLLIEVKGTRSNRLRFVWSANERRVAEIEKERYCIYCYTDIDLVSKHGVGPIVIWDPIHRLTQLGYTVEALDVLVQKPC